MTPPNYYLTDGKLYGPLDRMPPNINLQYIIDDIEGFSIYEPLWQEFNTYLSTISSHSHTFSGHSRIVPEGEIEWRYEVAWRNPDGTITGWKECEDMFHYEQQPYQYRRRVATPKITEGPELPNLSASTANLSQIKDKDEWLKDVRGEEQSIPAHVVDDMKLDSYYDGFKDGQAMAGEPDKQAIDRLIDKMDDGDVKITFGLQEHHIKRINEQAKKWGENKHLAVYSTHFWDNLAKEFAWEPFTLALYYFNHTNNPPSPQTGEKDMQVYELNVVIYSLIRFAQRVVNKYPDEFKDGKDRIEKAQYIASKYHKPEDTLRIVQSAPPAAQSDQEAAENWVNEYGVKFMAIEQQRKAFLAGCTHVRSQQQEELLQLRAWKAEAMQVMPDFQEIGKLIGVPLGQSVHDKIIPYLKLQQQVDAVALLRMGVDLVDRAYEHSTEESTEWIAKAHQFVTEARTFFTARHPTPKQGSHD